MNSEVTQYINKTLPWQIEVCNRLRTMIATTIPDIEEQMLYGKPHFLKNGQHAALIHVAKNKVSFMVFNAAHIDPVPGVLRSMGNGERKTADITEGQHTDYEQLARILTETSAKL